MVSESVVSDYLVIGAGSGGSVVVRRLLDAGHSVHVIEAGPVDADPAIHSPQGWPALFAGALDWGGFTTPQRYANQRQLSWPRGKVLGGSSALNGMIYMRGHPSDYDGWAATSGDPGWAWESVLPLFKRSESYALGANEFHGAGGPLPVSPIVSPHPLSAAFVNAAAADGYKVIDDFNAGEMVGVGYNDISTRDGKRMSAWTSFVTPVLCHPRLMVSTGALVHRVVVDDGRAVGVEYSRGQETPRRAYADAEVVLCAGSLGTPKALLLSGIGPVAHWNRSG